LNPLLLNYELSRSIRGVSASNKKDNNTTTNKAPMMTYCYSIVF